MSIRPSAKALIVHEGKLLLNRCLHADGRVYYDLPGGGQRPYEPIEQAVEREVREETGYSVRVGRYVALAEEIYTDSGLQKLYPDYTHRLLHIFLATLTGAPRALPSEMDLSMEKSEWIALEDVSHLPETYPPALKDRLSELLTGERALFLGTQWNDSAEP